MCAHSRPSTHTQTALKRAKQYVPFMSPLRLGAVPRAVLKRQESHLELELLTSGLQSREVLKTAENG